MMTTTSTRNNWNHLWKDTSTSWTFYNEAHGATKHV